MTFKVKNNNFNRDEMIFYIKEYFKTTNIKILEVGSFEGSYAERILNIFPNGSIYLLDLWDSEGNDFYYSIRPGLVENAYEKILERFKDKQNVHIIKGNSNILHNQFEDSFFDWIYIDGDHSYNGVKNDLNNWFKKLKINGILSGHDWDVDPSNQEFQQFGVKEALIDFLKEKKLSVDINLTNEFSHKSWFFKI